MNLINVSFGCDPEFFYKKGRSVIGAEKVLGKFKNSELATYEGKVIIDGIQAELNPLPSHCRNLESSTIATLFRNVNEHLPKGVSISLDPVVSVTKKEMASLSPACQQFGCTPSFNVYGVQEVAVRDASKYLKRSAGGHIHLGYLSITPKGLLEPSEIVPLLDAIVGNTCVLLDRHEGNKERRKNYGRAGEYRTPKYGIEYRTLSNFWLYNHTMMHLVFGLCRQAVSYLGNGKKDKILKLVDQKDIIKAINENDFDLAMANFKKLLPIFKATINNGSYPLNENSLVAFMYLVENGYKEVFKDEQGSYVNGEKPYKIVYADGTSRIGTKYGYRIGFENWANVTVEKMKKEKSEYYKSIIKSLK